MYLIQLLLPGFERELRPDPACTHIDRIDVDQLIAKADGALYAAKHEGRNQVRVAGEQQGQF